MGQHADRFGVEVADGIDKAEQLARARGVRLGASEGLTIKFLYANDHRGVNTFAFNGKFPVEGVCPGWLKDFASALKDNRMIPSGLRKVFDFMSK